MRRDDFQLKVRRPEAKPWIREVLIASYSSVIYLLTYEREHLK
jgi:hypothetical protein